MRVRLACDAASAPHSALLRPHARHRALLPRRRPARGRPGRAGAAARAQKQARVRLVTASSQAPLFSALYSALLPYRAR
jgi:hypothetical protein